MNIKLLVTDALASTSIRKIGFFVLLLPELSLYKNLVCIFQKPKYRMGKYSLSESLF